MLNVWSLSCPCMPSICQLPSSNLFHNQGAWYPKFSVVNTLHGVFLLSSRSNIYDLWDRSPWTRVIKYNLVGAFDKVLPDAYCYCCCALWQSFLYSFLRGPLPIQIACLTIVTSSMTSNKVRLYFVWCTFFAACNHCLYWCLVIRPVSVVYLSFLQSV